MPWCWWWAGWYVDWCEPEQLEGRRPVSVVQRQFTILRPDTFRPLSPSSHQHHTSASSIKYQLTLHLATSYHKKSFVYFEPTSAHCKVQCENIKICYSGFSSYSDYIFLSSSSSQHILHILRYFCRTWQTDKPVTRSVYPVTRSRDTHNNAGTFRLYFLQIPESEHFQFSAWVLRSPLSFLLEIFRLWAERVFWLLIVGLTLLQLLGDPLTGEHIGDAVAFLEFKWLIVFSFWLQDHISNRLEAERIYIEKLRFSWIYFESRQPHLVTFGSCYFCWRLEGAEGGGQKPGGLAGGWLEDVLSWSRQLDYIKQLTAQSNSVSKLQTLFDCWNIFR